MLVALVLSWLITVILEQTSFQDARILKIAQ
jgi:hypothetical protein